jgi:hypothetical protein
MTTWGELNSYGLSLRSLGHVEVLVRHNRSFFFLGSKDSVKSSTGPLVLDHHKQLVYIRSLS